jgi:hypothetical protein
VDTDSTLGLKLTALTRSLDFQNVFPGKCLPIHDSYHVRGIVSQKPPVFVEIYLGHISTVLIVHLTVILGAVAFFGSAGT